MSVAPGWHDAGAAGNYQTASLLAAADAVREVVGRGPPFTETTSKLRGARIFANRDMPEHARHAGGWVRGALRLCLAAPVGAPGPNSAWRLRTDILRKPDPQTRPLRIMRTGGHLDGAMAEFCMAERQQAGLEYPPPAYLTDAGQAQAPNR